MTPVLSPDITETTFPGSTRRVWRAPAVKSHALVALTPGRLDLVPADVDSELLANGDDLHAGPQSTAIELATITRIRHELVSNTLTIETLSSREPVMIVFSEPEISDDAYTRLWRRLGPALELRPFRPAFWTVAREPVGVMAGVLMATITLALFADAAADLIGTIPGSWARLARGLDWRWITGIGGAVLALAQVWLYRRLTRPPTRLELVRRSSH
jgi:hypothetical protein